MKLKLADRVKKLKEIKGITLATIGLAAGALCLFISGGSENASDKEGLALEESSESTLAEYAEAEEERVCALLNAVDGVRSARVLLTFESGSEYVYDTGGYSRNEPLLLEEHPPKVCGAAVVCVGGNDPDVKMKVIDLLCSLTEYRPRESALRARRDGKRKKPFSSYSTKTAILFSISLFLRLL